jgi:hypothetical protein
MDFERLTRLQLLMAETRHTLLRRFPVLPHGARVGFNYLPTGSEYAFGGDHALQVWYRDTTLRWVGRDEYANDTSMAIAGFVQFQSEHRPQIAIVDTEAMRMLLRAFAQLRAGATTQGLASLARAESLETDTSAVVFRGTVHALRATYWYFQNEMPRAVAEAQAAVALEPELVEPHFILAGVAFRNGNQAALISEYNTLRAMAPTDRRLIQLREQIERGR